MKNFKGFIKLMCVCLLLCILFVSCNTGDTSTETTNAIDETTNEPTADTSESKDKTVINAMSYNVWASGSIKDKTETSNDGTALPRMNVVLRGPKVNAMLNGEDIDVAGFQEVSNRSEWVKWIGNNLDEKYSYIAANTSDIESGVYIVYKKDRFEVIDSGAFCLVDNAPAVKEGTVQKYSDSDFERICTWAVFKVKDTGEIFLFMSTHLAAATAAGSNLTTSQLRSKQLEVLVSQISVLRDKVKTNHGISDCAVVLVGDMNSTPSSNEYSIITKTLKDSLRISKGKKVSEAYSTYTGFWHCKTELDYKKSNFRIDYIFVSTEAVSVLNYKMVHTSTNLCPYGEYMSDHNAVIAQLELY